MTEEQQEQIWDYYYGPARDAGEHAEEEGIGDSLTAVTESGEPGEQTMPRGRARLRKHLVVDEQSATVPGESGRA